MGRRTNRLMSVVLVLALACGILGAAGQTEKAPAAESGALKAAMLLSGPINDGGWNTSAYEGLLRLQKELGFEIAYTENVAQSEHKNLLRSYARRGYDLIIGHGFEFGDAILEVAAEFPEIAFYQVGGEAKAENVGSGVFSLGELSYLAGKLAAKFTKTGKIGFVGAMEIPTIMAEVNAMQKAIAEYNPSASFTIAFTGSWVDVNKGKEAALAQIANGVDVIICIGDACDVGAIQAAKEKNAYVVAYSGDMNHLAPNHVLTSIVEDVPQLVFSQGKMVKDGNWVPVSKAWGAREEAKYPGTWSSVVPEALKAELMADYEAMKNGTLNLRIN